jgi:prepilin-type N-terminal cleavage/methylation domain-containing protein
VAPRAFTLVELALVLVIIGMLAAIAAPRFAGASQRQRLRAAGERLALDVARLREDARAASGQGTIDFTRAGYRTGVTAGGVARAARQVALNEAPYFVTIAAVDAGGDSAVLFNGYGNPDSALSVTLEAGPYQATFAVGKDGASSLSAVSAPGAAR